MAVNRRLGFLALILTPLLISGRFLRNEWTEPKNDGQRFEAGDRIPLFANKIFSHAMPSDKGRPYFDLPFCPPGEPINKREKSLAEILSGDCFTNTQYEIRFNVSTFDNLLCEKTLTRAEVAKFRDAIAADFGYEMGFGSWLFRGRVGAIDNSEVSRPSAVCFLFGLLLVLLLASYFTGSFTSYFRGAGIHGNNCNCPPYSALLGAFLGSGIQLLITACILLYMAYSRRTLHPSNLILAYCLPSVVSGYKAVAFHLRFTRLGWKECTFLTGILYCIPAYSTVFLVNIVAQIYYGESDVGEVTKSPQLLNAWVALNGALSLLGGMIAYVLKGTSEALCSTRTTIPKREILPQPWHRKTLVQMLLGGLPPFVYVIKSMDNIYASLMHFKVCGVFSTVFSSFLLLIISTVFTALAFACLIDRSKDDYRWWWSATWGSTAIYMFLYCIYFASRVDIEAPFLVVYLGYNAGIFYALFLILGTISFYVSLINRRGFEKNE